MGDLLPERHTTEDIWRLRLREAHADLVSAQARANALQRAATKAPSPDTSYILHHAFGQETTALRRYKRVLCIFRDLVIDGKVPDEEAWRGGAGAES